MRNYMVVWVRKAYAPGLLGDNYRQEWVRAANHNQARLLAQTRIAPEGFEVLGVRFNGEWMWRA